MAQTLLAYGCVVLAAGWAPSDWIALVAVLATMASIAIAAIDRQREREARSREARRADRRRVGDVFGPVYAFVFEAYPGLLVWRLTEELATQRMEELRLRWKGLSDQVAATFASEEGDVARLANLVFLDVDRLLRADEEYVESALKEEDTLSARALALAEWKTTTQRIFAN